MRFDAGVAMRRYRGLELWRHAADEEISRYGAPEIWSSGSALQV